MTMARDETLQENDDTTSPLIDRDSGIKVQIFLYFLSVVHKHSAITANPLTHDDSLEQPI